MTTVSRPRVVPYQPRWPDEFRRVAAELKEHLGGLAARIDHIGSTSVPGLAAKDLIDIQVSVPELDLVQLVGRFESTDYKYVPRIHHDHRPPGADGGESDWSKAFFERRLPPPEVHVHVRVEGAPNTRYALLFRDYLREHPRAAAAYAELKQRLSTIEPPIDVGTYADVKDPVCDVVIVAAEDWAAQVGWKAGESGC